MTEAGGAYRAGIAALAAAAPAEALPLLRRAVAAGEGGAHAELNLGLALAQLGRLAEAVAPLERAAAALPEMAEPQVRLGQILGLRGEGERAATCFRAALDRDPGHVPALAGLAALEEASGRLQAAAALIRTARARDPAEPELRVIAARLALATGDATVALADAEAALAERACHAEAALIVARALLALHPPEAAARHIAARAAADPFAAGWPLAAASLRAVTGDLGGALAELCAAEALAPDSPEVQGELGKALAAAGRAEEAEAALRRAIAARPEEVGLRNRLATVLWKGHRIGEALDILDAAVADFGPEPVLLMNLALLRNLQGDQAGALAAADAAVASGGGRDALVTRLSVLPYHPAADAAALLATARSVAATLGPAAPMQAAAVRGAPDPDRPLRIGLLSGNLCMHPVGWLTVAGIEALPEAEFSVAAYSLRQRRDPVAARFRARCAVWREVGAAADRDVAALIAADGVDVLLDLGGYGEGGRPFVAQHRPAPVQVKWVGSQAATTGLPGMDWMLTDRWETPAGHERFYTERLLRMPDGYVCYAPPPYAPAPAAPPALASGWITFGCFNNLAKVTPAVLAAWARILAALPDSRLVLLTHALADAGTREALRLRMLRAGLPADRVELRGGVPHRTLLEAYRGIDIALDPFPYTGGLTVCEALWMGVPVVSLAGDGFAARHALSHLSNVGLADWVAEDVDAYVALAIERARDPDGLVALRAGLRQRMRDSPLCDSPRFGRSLGGALRMAWRDWCARAG